MNVNISAARVLCGFLFLLVLGASHANEASFVLGNVRVFDGQETLEVAAVTVRDGKIASVTPGPASTEVSKGEGFIDGSGQTLIPGLINAHVHVVRPDEHLPEAVRAGVLTVIDLLGTASRKSELRAQRNTLGRADVFAAGDGATAPGGHGTQFGNDAPTLVHPEEAEAFVQMRLSEGSEYLKVIIEDSGGRRNRLSDETIIALAKAAQESDLLAVAHVSRFSDALLAIEAGMNGLVHMWWRDDQPMTDAELEQLTARPFFLSPTLLLRERRQGFRERLPERLEQMQAELMRLKEAGVTLLAGTDPPNVGINFGTDLYEELRLLVEAGLTPEEALAAATFNVATAYRLPDRGAIREGLRADLVLIDGNPTDDLADLRNISRIWQRGMEVSDGLVR